jgi:UDP-glucuronate 4-epimerase
VAAQLLSRSERVLGLENLNASYNPALKQARLARLARLAAQLDRPEAWKFLRLDLSDGLAIAQLFDSEQLRAVVHLAAQAGVRHSLENPAV